MTEKQRQTVGDRGQVTIPQELRARFSLSGGDEVLIHEEDGKLVIEPPVSRELLAEGYRKRAERDRELADELEHISRKADSHLGDAPDWEE